MNERDHMRYLNREYIYIYISILIDYSITGRVEVVEDVGEFERTVTDIKIKGCWNVNVMVVWRMQAAVINMCTALNHRVSSHHFRPCLPRQRRQRRATVQLKLQSQSRSQLNTNQKTELKSTSLNYVCT